MMLPRQTPAFLSLIAALVAAGPVAAAQTREPSQAERYVKMRAASTAGDLETTTSELAVLLAHDPGSDVIAQRAYREAIAAGDKPLALKAARALEQQGQLPPDAPLLFLVDAVQAKDWKRARAQVDQLEAGKLFAFMAPILRAWIAVGSHDGDPIAALEPARQGGLGSAYFPGQHAILLLATGRVDEGAAEVSVLPNAGSRLRLAAATALQKARKPEQAAKFLDGDDPVLVAARARLAAGGRIDIGYDNAGAGIADLLTQVAIDFNRQRLAPVATMLGRLSTFADPDNSGGWIATANFLGIAKRRDAALAALDHVPNDDPYAGAAERLRIALLVDKDDKAAALAVAMTAAARPGAGSAEWARVADVQMALDKPMLAAAAYEKAIAAAGANAAAEDVWPYWLQRGAALEEGGDWAGAKAALDKAYAMAPDQAVVLNHLGYSLLSRREDLPQATKLIESANKLRPDDAAITDSLGWAKFVGGDAKSAVVLLERASAGEPGEPTINEHLGDVYWALGRRIEARYAWRAALVTADAKDVDRIKSKIATAPTPATAAP
jgi:tetratricopeptide (TPR) repeat protein